MSAIFTDRFLRGLGIFSFIFFFSIGCGQQKSPQDVPALDPSTSDSVPLYPHFAGWGDAANHGAGYSQYGLPACLTCHQEDITPAHGPLACKSCHALFPHTDSWVIPGNPDNHGRHVVAHGQNSCATQCHGSDLRGGLSGVNCNSCHHSSSSGGDWAGSAHGLAALDLTSRNRCKTCHGEDLLGGTSGVSCKRCHTEFPHTSNWSVLQHTSETHEVCNDDDEDGIEECSSIVTDNLHANLHGQRFVEQKVAGFPTTPNICSSCHGANYEGGNSHVSCISCHPNYPHAPNWKVTDPLAIPLGGQHGPAFLSGPRNFTSSCTQCHPQFGVGLDFLDLDVSVQAPACNSCHVFYPHLKSPEVAIVDDWLTGSTSSSHSVQFLYESFTEGPGSPNLCKDCHGNNLLGAGSAAKNCASCHEHFGSVSHEGCCRVTSHPGAPWRQTSHHGNVYLNSLASGVSFDGRCGKCHESSLKRDPTVCNPYPSNKDACNICHKAPAVACSTALCLGMSAEGVCP